MKDCDSCEDIFKNTQENPCDNCEYRKVIARAFDLHWLCKEDCPYKACAESNTITINRNKAFEFHVDENVSPVELMKRMMTNDRD